MTWPCAFCGAEKSPAVRLGETCHCGKPDCVRLAVAFDAFMTSWSHAENSNDFKRRFMNKVHECTERNTGNGQMLGKELHKRSKSRPPAR